MRNALIMLLAILAMTAIFTPRGDDAAAKPGLASATTPRSHGKSAFGPEEDVEGPVSTNPASTNLDGPTVLLRDETGQFHVTARVEGRDAKFLVDTGADAVALTVDQAQELGLDIDRSQFQPISQTASGVGYGAEVVLSRFEVAGTELRDVHALVVEGLTVNLLGQNVLKRLGRVELEGDRMVLRH